MTEVFNGDRFLEVFRGVFLSSENEKWVRDFQNQNKRKPRILMIGNIANNAYCNAKLLNECGFECVVICYGYYHIMGCPEWEDGNFNPNHIDHYRPDWTEVPLKGFERPEWFIQGELASCLAYCLVRGADGSSGEKEKLWRKLLIQCKLRVPNSSDWIFERATRIKALINYIIKRLFLKTINFSIRTIDWIVRKSGIVRLKLGLFRVLRLLKSIWISLWSRIFNIRAQLEPGNTLQKIVYNLPPNVYRFLDFKIDQVFVTSLLSIFETSLLSTKKQDTFFENQVALMVTDFSEQFPEREDKLTTDDCSSYRFVIPEWKTVLEKFDFVIAFSTDPILPMFSDLPYFAFEHGTLRDIPFENNLTGRLTALAYRRAEHVFVTNLDCVEKAKFLAPGKVSFVNHPFDENSGDVIEGVSELRTELLQKLKSQFLFFHPTRHDWVEGTGYADKGNNIFLQAFAELRGLGHEVGLVCCGWGANVAQSKEFLDKADCSSFTQWIEPLPNIPFQRMCKATDVLVDQFKLGAFGGVMYKGMSAGAVVLTYLSIEDTLKQYSEMPPILNEHSVNGIVEGLVPLIKDRSRLRSFEKESKDWIRQHHTKSQIINTQVEKLSAFWLRNSKS
ncbi:MAG: hypothetical protein VX986_02485 [Pseudomonadota bacterium]|nr:hypothetical protein [Pseudomonadota bacterium]